MYRSIKLSATEIHHKSPILAASSTSSCSPPVARKHNLRSERRRILEEANVPRSGGQSTKRFLQDDSVDNPRKKSSQTPSIYDVVEGLIRYLEKKRELEARHITEAEEIAQVHQILEEDGYNEIDDAFIHAKIVCANCRGLRRAFLDMETKEGRFKFVKTAWKLLSANSK